MVTSPVAAGAPIEFRMLGPLEVLADGRPVALGGARQRGVLAILLLHRREVVSVDRIVDELWGERTPGYGDQDGPGLRLATSQGARRRRARHARRWLRARGGRGSRWTPPASSAWRARAARRSNAAMPPAPPQTLREALSLWRGPPLADFAYESFAQNEIARLEELRLAATRIASRPTWLSAVTVRSFPSSRPWCEHPARERLRAQLMLALYRSGRQSDALESYRDAQRTLVEELGLEPGPELQRLERAILAQDPAIEAPPRPAPVAALRRRRRGGAMVVLGGGLLLAAALAAIVLAIDDDAASELAGANSLAVIDPASNRLDSTVPTGGQPAEVSADADHVWVANRDDDTVTQVDPATREVVGRRRRASALPGSRRRRRRLDRRQPAREARAHRSGFSFGGRLDPARSGPGGVRRVDHEPGRRR